MPTPPCDGVVQSLQGHRVMLTGTIHLDGRKAERRKLEPLLRAGGAHVIPSGTRNRTVTLLVQGSLPPSIVTDPVRVRSQKAVLVDAERRRGRHVCIVDDAGLTNLLMYGFTAACLESRAPAGEDVTLAKPAPVVLGSAFTPAVVAAHGRSEVLVDMEHLAERTQGHERLLLELMAQLPASATLRLPGTDQPRFDAGWDDPCDGGHVYIVEAKTLQEGSVNGQLRLGLGQVLDYAQAVREALQARRVTPVLLVDRAPEERWRRVLESVGAILIHPEKSGSSRLRGIPPGEPA